jgi:SAM-dependent methyltransferase
MLDICEARSHIDFYADAFKKGMEDCGCNEILSLGSGDGQVEVAIAALLKKGGETDFHFTCAELSSIQISRARANAEARGLGKHFLFMEVDLNSWIPEGTKFAGIMAHHSLHHVVELEHLFAGVREALHPQGRFASMDMIGRNGHMRWPEAFEIVRRIWAFLPDEKKYHRFLKVLDKDYTDRDQIGDGFEGVRAQDILPLLTKDFGFVNFLAWGGLTESFSGWNFGDNYDPADERDVAFMDFIQFVNDLLIDLGHLKPTNMCATMVLDKSVKPRTYRHWTPEFCVRLTSGVGENQ